MTKNETPQDRSADDMPEVEQAGPYDRAIAEATRFEEEDRAAVARGESPNWWERSTRASAPAPTHTRRIASHDVANVPAGQVEPGMVTLYGVVLSVTDDGTAYTFTMPGNNSLIALAADPGGVTILGRLHPQTLAQVQSMGAARAEVKP